MTINCYNSSASKHCNRGRFKRRMGQHDFPFASHPMNKESSPRVLHLASGDLWAGAEAQLFTLVTTLHHSLRVPVSVVLFNHGTLEYRLRNAGIEVLVLDESRLNSLQILRKLMRIIPQYHPDIIHTHGFKQNILASLATLFSGNTPSLRTVHGAAEYHVSWKQPAKRAHLVS